MTTLTVGTFNVWKHAPLVGLHSDLDSLARTNTDVIGLQEVKGGDRHKVLQAYPGWGVYAPHEPNRAEFDPIIWREDRFALRSVGTRRVARGGWVRRDSVPVRYANWVELEDQVTGRTVFVVNTHLHAKIDRRGRPSRRPRSRQAVRHIAALGRLADYLGQSGEVFVTGDFNIGWDADKREQHPKFPHQVLYRGHNLIPCWAWSRSKGGTHKGDRKIDYVWHRRSEAVSPAKTRILRDGYHSDHKPVLATYNIEE